MSTNRQQILTALERGNQLRFARADVKRRLHAGELTIPEALRIPECAGARLSDLLAAQRRWGKVRVTKVLRAIDASPWQTVGGLSPRQMEALTRLLRVIRPTGNGALQAARDESPWVSRDDGPVAA